MPKRFHSSLILVVVFGLGLAAGIAGMVWAWPGVHARYFPHHREPFIHRLQRTLELSPQQVTQVQGVLKDVNQFRHQVHLQYVPDYVRVCQEFTQISTKEGDAYFQSPVRKQYMGKLQAIMSSSQWQQFSKNLNHGHGHGPLPDLCRHLNHKHGNAPPPAPKSATPPASSHSR